MTYKLSTSKTTKTHSYVSFLLYYLALSTIRQLDQGFEYSSGPCSVGSFAEHRIQQQHLVHMND